MSVLARSHINVKLVNFILALISANVLIYLFGILINIYSIISLFFVSVCNPIISIGSSLSAIFYMHTGMYTGFIAVTNCACLPVNWCTINIVIIGCLFHI